MRGAYPQNKEHLSSLVQYLLHLRPESWIAALQYWYQSSPQAARNQTVQDEIHSILLLASDNEPQHPKIAYPLHYRKSYHGDNT